MGEGPQLSAAAPLQGQGFNEGKGKPFTAEDVRFTTKGGVLYAFVMGAPKTAVHLKSLGIAAKLLDAKITGVSLLGSAEKLKWSQTNDALVIELPQKISSEIATVFEISTAASSAQ